MTFIAKAMQRAGSEAGSNPEKPTTPAEQVPPPRQPREKLTFVSRAMESGQMSTGEADQATPSPTAAVLRPAGPMARPAGRRVEPRIAPRTAVESTQIEGSPPPDVRQGIPLPWVVAGFGFLAIGVGFIAMPGASDEAPSQAAPTAGIASTAPVPNVPVVLTSATVISANTGIPVAAAAAPPVRVKTSMPVIELAAEPVSEVPRPVLPPEPAVEPAPVVISEPAQLRARAMEILGNYKLEGVFFSKTDPAAIINDRILDPGDTIGDLKVIEIRRHSVIVEIAGEQLELR